MKISKTALSLLTISALALSACGNASTGNNSDPNALTIATTDEVDNLDPASTYTGWFTNRDGISETLVDVDDKLQLTPKLATSWKLRDETTWEFTLRENVTFHNGAPMTAAAVKTSIEHALETNVRAKSQLPIESIEADGQKLTITTTRSLPALPHVMADPMMGIQAIGAGINPSNAPVATGPYKVKEFTKGQRHVLTAHQKYWQGKPRLNTITVRTYGDEQSISLALQSGEADIVVRPDAANLNIFQDTSRFTTWNTSSTRSDGVIINTSSPTMSDPRARQAINAALDRNAYVSLLHGKAEALYSYFPASVAFGTTDGLAIPVTKKDLSSTKKTLIELGYSERDGKLTKDEKPLTLKVLTYPKRPYLGQLAQVLQSDLRSIGVTVEIKEMKDTTEAMKAGDFDLAMYSMATAPTGDPEYFFDTMLRSTSESNFSHWKSPEFDKSLDKLSNATDSEERITATKESENILVKELPYIMVGNQKWWAVSKSAVKNLHLRPTECHLIGHDTHVE
ncbi:Nickel-binding periplasmic protein precursor [Dermatophilus congolensis]|uniref:Nickel-binding periplasmic protein n=1 Tax=Dermatophilus congolensis TaxID=1863 RepID=A0AA46H175_9MICO|nr:ABC transporter substrate-binding protein [Dermatophilus congolensis]STD13702.1 Nickel-binding periplasmic protein precursor [Dermatophilus congolensis]